MFRVGTRRLAAALALLFGIGCGGKRLGERCKLGECGSGLTCTIGQVCQNEGGCQGVCRISCSYSSTSGCPEPLVCACAQIVCGFCAPSDCPNPQSPTCH